MPFLTVFCLCSNQEVTRKLGRPSSCPSPPLRCPPPDTPHSLIFTTVALQHPPLTSHPPLLHPHSPFTLHTALLPHSHTPTTPPNTPISLLSLSLFRSTLDMTTRYQGQEASTSKPTPYRVPDTNSCVSSAFNISGTCVAAARVGEVQSSLYRVQGLESSVKDIGLLAEEMSWQC